MDSRRRSIRSKDFYRFTLCPTSPPSTSVYMRGGLVYNLPSSGGGWFVDDQTFDFTDSSVTGTSFAFSAKKYYTYFAVGLRGGGSPIITGSTLLIDVGDQYKTATEVEEAAIASTQDVYNGSIPLGIVILKNNGIIMVDNQFMPIDAVNRGRSYLFKRRTMAVRSEL